MFGLVLVMTMSAPVAAQEITTIRLAAPDRVASSEELGPAVRFGGVSSIRELAEGGVLVADYQALRLVRIDWSGGHARALTPPSRLTESSRPSRLCPLRGDSTLYTNAMTREWAILADTAVVRFFDRLGGLVAELGPNLDGCDPTGRVLGSRPHPYDPRKYLEPADTLVALLGDPDGTRVDTVARLRGPAHFANDAAQVPYHNGTLFLGNPYRTHEMARYFPDQWVAVARMDPYRVDWRSADGRWILGDPLPFTPRRVDEAERCFALEALRGSCEFADRLDWPRVVPPFTMDNYGGGHRFHAPTLLGMPRGNLLIRRAPVSSRPDRQYDVVDRRGRLVARLMVAPNVAIVGFGAASVYTVEVDASGTETLRRHPWHGVMP